MKKILSALLVTVQLLSFLSVPASAAYEAPTIFSMVYDYGDSVYTTEFCGTEGGIVFRSREALYLLPKIYTGNEYDYIYSFCIYHDKFYLLVSEEASIDVPARIYSCNMDGSGLTLLADNACNFSNVYIVDGILYYDAYTSSPYWDDYPGYYGGIYSINLYDLSWKKISGDSNAMISYCDGDYVYYSIDSYNSDYPIAYAIKTDGTGKMMVNRNCDEFANFWDESIRGYLKGNQFYYFSDNQLYVRNKNGGNSRWLGALPSCDYGYIANVTDNYIHCIAMNFDNEGYPFADIYKFNR